MLAICMLCSGSVDDIVEWSDEAEGERDDCREDEGEDDGGDEGF